jgi:hypothetical protein
MKKIALTLATAAGIVALSAGPASAASPVSASSSAVGQAQDNATYQMEQMEQMQQYQLNAGEKAAALEANATAMRMAQAAANAMKDANSGYAS